MDANSTTGLDNTTQAPPAGAIPPPPPGMAYIAAIEIPLNLIIIIGAFSAALVPLFFALFLFSTKALRKSVIFNLNVASVVLGMTLGVVNYYIEVKNILEPLNPHSVSWDIVHGTIVIVIPLLVESILVLRVWAVYPPGQLPRTKMIAIYLPMVVLKLARVGNALAFFIEYWPDLVKGSLNTFVLAKVSWEAPSAKISWALQVVDAAFTSLLFLLKVRKGLSDSGHEGRVSSRVGSNSYLSRLRALFWISVSNFVFPTLFALVQFIMAVTNFNFIIGIYIYTVNTFVNIIGVLFATIWSAGSRPGAEITQLTGGQPYSHSNTFLANRRTPASTTAQFQVATTTSALENGIKMGTFSDRSGSVHGEERKF